MNVPKHLYPEFENQPKDIDTIPKHPRTVHIFKMGRIIFIQDSLGEDTMRRNNSRGLTFFVLLGLAITWAVLASACDFFDREPHSPDSGVEYDVHSDGPFATRQDLRGGPKGDSGVFYPADLGREGFEHPIFLWGCGGSSAPSDYTFHMNRIASHGFVVIAEVSRIEGNGAVLKASLEWIIKENQRPQSIFYQKLDIAKIALGGHSIGSVNAFAIADDPRLTTTIHVAGGSLDGQGTEALKLIHPAAYICSENDMFGNVEKAEADYVVTTVPVFFTKMTGVGHVAAAREGLDAMVAWLRWFLLDETERRHMFLDGDGEFCTGKYVSKSKNWF